MTTEAIALTAQQVTAQLGPYTTPEACYKKACELYKQDSNWQEALVVLHVGIQNRRTKSNMLILEKLMTLMIDICAENLTTLYLKEDIGYFRNMCQHQSTSLLEKVLTYLRNKSEREYEKLEREYSPEILARFLGDEQPADSPKPELDAATGSPEELMFLAYTSIDALEQKNSIMPRVTFFLETCKNILDTLRSNSRLLEFYNETCRKVFAFCKKYKAKKDFRRISETLHNHFNQVVRHDKMLDQPQTNPKFRVPYPFPIRLDEEAQVTQVLKIRKEQLELALTLGEWTDAHHTSNNIYTLMRKSSRGKSEQEMLQLQLEFYRQLASIFWESNLYLFHSYALQNVQLISKSMKGVEKDQKLLNNDSFVLAALSVPLNNKLTNFERLDFSVPPTALKMGNAVGSAAAREEITETANMLHVSGLPSRTNIIHYVNIEHLQQGCSRYVADLFELVEHEQSPFVIAKRAKAALDLLAKDEKLAKYGAFVAKSLAVRVLQKCKNFYSTMYVDKLLKLLSFSPYYATETDVAQLLFECNREELLFTTLSYAGGKGPVLTFNAEARVVEGLFNFGDRLREVFQEIKAATTHGRQQRQRIFLKVKEKLDEEADAVKAQKEAMVLAQQQLAEQKEREAAELEKQRAADEAARIRDQAQQKIRDEQRRKRNEIVEALEVQKKMRAVEILTHLQQKGYRKVKKERIKDLLVQHDKINYDDTIDFYQGVLKKERERIEEDKKKKMREVELWNRALREEEKTAIERYAAEHGEEKMKAIQESMRERQEKEQRDKDALKTAQGAFAKYMASAMDKRNTQWEAKKADYVATKMAEVKEQVLASARHELLIEENRALQAKRQAAFRAREDEKAKALGDVDESGAPTSEWGRGAARPERPVFDDARAGRDGGAPRDSGFITRSDRPRATGGEEEKTRPTFGRRAPRDDGPSDSGFGGFRTNATAKKQEDKPAASGPPRFTRGGAAPAGGAKPSSGGDGGFGGFRSQAKRK